MAGITNMAYTNDAVKENKTVHGNNCTKSPKGPVIILIIGRNIMLIPIVAINMGINNSLALVTAASKGA